MKNDRQTATSRVGVPKAAFALLAVSLFLTSACAVGPAGSEVKMVREPVLAPGVIGSAAGTGPYPAIAEARVDAPGYTIYRPLDLPEQPLPLVIWGNGACADNGLSASHFLREIASRGYIIVANGSPRQEREVLAQLPEVNGPPVIPVGEPVVNPRRTPDETSTDQAAGAIDWMTAANASSGDMFSGHVDLSRIGSMGHSCGGQQALKLGGDPRIGTVVAFASGIYTQPGMRQSGVDITKADLQKLHTSVAYIIGGPQDVASRFAWGDFELIDHVPVFIGTVPVGHGGTFALENGGVWAEVGAAWLDWQLKGDEAAGSWFAGPECGLCERPEWTVQSKNLPLAP